MTLRIDFSNMMVQPGGIPEKLWRDSANLFSAAHAGVEMLRNSGTIGFIDLPSDEKLLGQVADFTAKVRGRYSDVVVLGIGGSALGPIALRTALRPSGWNLLDDKARGGFPRLHVLDNVDPVTIAALLERLALEKTLFIVTSKSGGTAETMAQFLIIEERLRNKGLPVASHFVFVTDPKNGALRALVGSLGVTALDIPPNVGGRFSVLTPVGTLPAALIGIDVRALLAGAGKMAERCSGNDLSTNPAGMYSLAGWLADTKLGKNIHVLMPYSDPLRDFAAWFVQLWAESLGKHKPDGSSVGGTPLGALGATDQHSQVQLFMEGPANKTVTFIAVEDHNVDLKIPNGHSEIAELGYLGGHSLAELLSIEQRATAGALAKRGRPNLTIHIGKVDEPTVGELIMFFEIVTAYVGQLHGIDAFNQPGVELGKQFAYALLGRPGADAAKKEWDSLPKADSRWTI